MSATTIAPLTEPGDVFARVLSLYEQGRCLDAWEAGKSQGELRNWPAVEPRILACRLAHHLGAPELSARLSLATFRAFPTHPLAQYYYVNRVLERRGALAAWRERTLLGAPADNDGTTVGDYHGQCAQILGMLRDFDAAESHIAKARTSPERPYWFVERASLFMQEDRYEDALSVAREGLARSPSYPPSILSTALTLQMLERPDESLELLRSAAAETQSSHVLSFLIGVLLKRRRLEEAEGAAVRYDELTPLKEEAALNLLAVTRADIAVHRGDYQQAMSLVETVKHPFYATVAENLRSFLAEASGTPPRRVELEVPFVRQHHMTCSPATLTAISRFWRRPAVHTEVAEEICYDGTPYHSERRWANENGWRTAEFRVDWDSTVGLVDRGVPFTLTLSDAASGHLVAVIGYDRPRDLLLARDPATPLTIEINAREIFRQQAAVGPRGMALVPHDQGGLLDGLTLPEAELYDLYHEFELALERHDRDAALALHGRMIALDPRQRLTLHARRSLAAYDDNPHDGLSAIDELLQLYPDDPSLLLLRLGCLRQLATRDDRLNWLEQVGKMPSADPLLWLEHAGELMNDNRLLLQARHHVRRALRRRPDDPHGIYQLGRLTWGLGNQVEAVELYRFAACIGNMREDLAQAYFTACRSVDQTATAIAFLHKRVERLGAQSARPAMTLFGALETLDRMDEAFAALESALARRPDDNELLIFMANRCAAWGRGPEAAAHLAAARGAKRNLILAEEARAARLAGERGRALEAWREVLASRPLDLEAHRAVAQLLSDTSDADAAQQHLRAYCDRFPHNEGLWHLLYEWTAALPAAEREQALRKLRTINPANAWTVRELALNLCLQARFDDALALADESIALDDGSAPSHNVRAYVLHGAGRRPEAAESYRAAIGRSADAGDAMRGLLNTAGETRAQALEVLAFIENQLLQQPVVGDGVLTFHTVARGILTPAELSLPLERLHEKRPDLWQSWSALGIHLAETGQTDNALELARRATERFSHVPRLWLDLSRVHRARHEPEQEIAALRRCREINPEWAYPVGELADALTRGGKMDEAEHVLASGIRLMPLASELRGHLAELVHKRGQADRAIEILREALRVDPDYAWAWESLTEWSQRQGRTTFALDLATAFAESRAGESRAWLQLADLRSRVGQFDGAFEAVERALTISPHNVQAHDYKATVLAELRRFHEAELACNPPIFGDKPPLILQGRAAWVDARRGDLSRGIAQMEALVNAHPDYDWGWNQLVNWHARLDANLPAIHAAERVVWLEPHNPQPLTWVGELKLRRGDHKGAAEAFQRAMRLQPNDVDAGFQLFELQRKGRDYEAARRTLEILRPFAVRADILAAEAQLAASQNDRDAYLAALRELCETPDTGPHAPVRVIEALVRGDWRRAVERTLREAIARPTWNPITPALWVRVRARRGRLGGPLAYRWLAGLGEPGKQAIVEVLDHIGAAARHAAGSLEVHTRITIQLLLIRYLFTRWRKDNGYWGQFGYALTCSGKRRWCVRWMCDWRERSNLEPWMLQNLISSLLGLRRADAAREVLRTVAHNLATRMDIGVILGLWGAISACLDNDLPLAERLMHETPRDVVPDQHRRLWDFATTMLDICRDTPTAVSLTRERARALDNAFADVRTPSDTGYLVRLAMLRIARHVHHPWRTVRAWIGLYGRRLLLYAGLIYLAFVVGSAIAGG